MLIGPLRSGRAPTWEPVRFIIDQRRDGLVRAVALSGLLHIALVASLLFIARSSAPKGSIYPTYTVDLVGGEKLGGAMPAPRPAPAQPAAPVAPSPEAKQESVKTKEEPTPRITAKERRKLAAERKAAEAAEKAAEKALALKTKKEAKKAEKIAPKKEEAPAAQKEQELPAAVRERLIAAMLERTKERVESEQNRQKAAAQPPVVVPRPGEGQGAAGPGVGGKGGGVFKGIEFARYINEIQQRIRSSWTWVGRRTDLEVIVRLSIRENGEITGLRLTSSSGDPSYDDSVMRAIKKANPLPPPPESYRAEFADVDVRFTAKDMM